MVYIRSIEFPMRLAGIRMGTVNCYLITAGTGYVMVDTAFAANRAGLERELQDAGCRPGDLRLIVMTHGDLDHTATAHASARSTARKSPWTGMNPRWSRTVTTP